MERVLRSKEMAEIILLPVRHHSPACAWHVKKMLEKLQPAMILVEGPDNANPLIPVMIHEETKAPFAIYYSYHDTTARISEEKEHYRCYYPFLDYSPELAALRTGQRLGIETAFVDLPYGDILAASRQGQGLLKKDEEKNNYNDDYLLSRNDYLKQLCEKTGLRSFDEFWEKYFELNGLGEESENWFSNLLTYCRLARENTAAESMEADGCLARERHMADRILEYAGKAAGKGPVAAVTGGFHTPGLKELLEREGAKVFCGGLTAAGSVDVKTDGVKNENAETGEIENRGVEFLTAEGRDIQSGTEENGDAETHRLEYRNTQISDAGDGSVETDLPENRKAETGAMRNEDAEIYKAENGNAETVAMRNEDTEIYKAENGNTETDDADIEESDGKAAKEENGSGNSGKRQVKIPDKDQGVYLMPYSMEAADALNGYASGMPFTGFYQKIWDGLADITAPELSGTDRESADIGSIDIRSTDIGSFTDKKRTHTGGTDDICTPYADAVLDMIVAAGKETRRKEGYLSTYDEICACSMARGLAELRGKREPGAYELLDAVLSSFVKGEYNIASDTPMRILRKHMTGNAVGALCSQADVPPIIHDFEAQCKAFGWKIKSTLEAEVTLSIFSNKKHRQESMFFNRMLFLKTAFARKVKGPNLQLKKDKNLMREIWKYKWNAQVNSALIDVSVYGATIEEAAAGLVKEELKKELNAKEGALLLTYVFEMGLTEQLQITFDRVHELMLADTSFYSLAEAVKSLMMMEELGSLYESRMEFGDLIHLGCRKLIMLLPSMTRIKDEDLTQCMDALKLLYQITGRNQEQYGQERESYYGALDQMNQDSEIHSGLNGCIYGILYGSGRETAEQVEMVCRGYLLGTKEQMLHTAQFFKGLFYTARDLVFIGDEFLRMLDEFFGRVSEAEFMELLPELRMAFAYFTPREIDKIAAGAAGLHGKSRDDLMEGQEVLPEWYSYGKEIDGYVRENM